MNHTKHPHSSGRSVRTTISVSPDVLAQFDELARVTGVSRSKALGEWLADTVDAAKSMTELMRKARQSPRMFAAEMQGYALGLTDLTSQLVSDVREMSKNMPKTELPPRMSNTGGKLGKEGKKGRE